MARLNLEEGTTIRGAQIIGGLSAPTQTAAPAGGSTTSVASMPFIQFFNPAASATIKLPAHVAGSIQYGILANLATAGKDLTVQDSAAGAVTTLVGATAALLVSDGATWRRIVLV